MSPFYGRLPNVQGFGVDTTAEKVGLAAVGAVAGLSVAHGVGKAVQHAHENRAEGRADHEPDVPPGDRPADSDPPAGGARADQD